MSLDALPETQWALVLAGAGRLTLVRDKPVPRPGPHQVLCRVEAAGLCFSDQKLLDQFAAHPRKQAVARGIDPAVLAEIPSYRPGDAPTVPGHEACVTVVAAGPGTRTPLGARRLVQTDYRWLPTAGGSAASFGYNFEGALQEYVLMDERVIVSPEGDSMLLPVPEDLGASEVALVEPWACVEHAYAAPERTTALGGGRLLVVVEPGRVPRGLEACYAPGEGPGRTTRIGPDQPPLAALDALAPPGAEDGPPFDDVVYFGANPAVVERLDALLAAGGVLNVALGGALLGRPVEIGIGRSHYGRIRVVGTPGERADEALRRIPPAPELRPGEEVLILGAGGPMGRMHALRCLTRPGVARVTAVDLDAGRLESLRRLAAPLLRPGGPALRLVDASEHAAPEGATCVVVMIPDAALVARALEQAAPGAIVNVFAGVPASVRHAAPLDDMIANGKFLTGTSGSTVRDMGAVLERVAAGTLDTNASVGAAAGLAGALDGMEAVARRTVAGKIVVYPGLREMPLTPLENLAAERPRVAAALQDGRWTRAAERALLSED